MSNPVRLISCFIASLMLCALAMQAQAAPSGMPAPPAMPVGKVVRETLPDASPPSGPVVVELFTAESCVFCPQAERLFGQLAGQPGVIGLACHVDYLKDGDPLARDFCIDRQNWYMDRLHDGPNYTPQLIVNGMKDALGYRIGIVTALVRQGRGDKIAPIAITPLNAGRTADAQFAVTLPAGAVKTGLAGWQLTVMTFLKPTAVTAGNEKSVGVQDDGARDNVRVADNMQVLPLDRYRGLAFRLTVPLSDTEAGMVVLLQRQDTGRIAAAGQFVKGDTPADSTAPAAVPVRK